MNILFICTGNTCRSPMAEGYLDSKNLPDVKVESRGLSADGSPVSENSVKAMAEKGIDISTDVSCQLTQSDLARADKILYMSPSHYTVLRLYAPDSKLFMLGDGISDPFGGDLNTYKKCRDEIFSAIDLLIAEDFFTERVIKKADQSHINAIARLEKECFSTPWSETSLREAMGENTRFFICSKGDSVLGYVGISVILDEGYITNICVTKTERGKGIGSELLNRIFALAKDNGLSFVTLEVRTSNQKAISLYEKFGFKEEGRRKGFYASPKEDAIILTKRF